MIKVSGQITYNARFDVELDITEEQYDAMSMRQLDSMLEDAIDHSAIMRSAETDDIDVWDVENLDSEDEE